jgi:transcription elongation factor GreA-like protein
VIDIFLEPGVLVRHPDRDDWGVGQVQSVAGVMVTVNFEDAGKQTINAERVHLTFVGDNPRNRR